MRHFSLSVHEGTALMAFRRFADLLNVDSLVLLEKALEKLASDTQLVCLVMEGIGTLDSQESAEIANLFDCSKDLLLAFYRALFALARFPVPTVAIIDSPAHSASSEIALCCDILVMSEGASLQARPRLAGDIPLLASLARPEFMPKALTWETLLDGRALNAQECLKWNIVHLVVPAKNFCQVWKDRLSGLLKGRSPDEARRFKCALMSSRTWDARFEKTRPL